MTEEGGGGQEKKNEDGKGARECRKKGKMDVKEKN